METTEPKKPPVERRGRHLTPGERFRNWVDSIVKLWPLIIPLAAGNAYHSPAVKEFVHGPPPTVEDVQPPEKPEYYRKSIEDIITKLKDLDKKGDEIQTQLRRSDNKNYQALSREISELKGQISTIQELVN